MKNKVAKHPIRFEHLKNGDIIQFKTKNMSWSVSIWKIEDIGLRVPGQAVCLNEKGFGWFAPNPNVSYRILQPSGKWKDTYEDKIQMVNISINIKASQRAEFEAELNRLFLKYDLTVNDKLCKVSPL